MRDTRALLRSSHNVVPLALSLQVAPAGTQFRVSMKASFTSKEEAANALAHYRSERDRLTKKTMIKLMLGNTLQRVRFAQSEKDISITVELSEQVLRRILTLAIAQLRMLGPATPP